MPRFRALVAVLAIVLMAVASNQAITRGYIYSNIGSLFTWSGTAQTSWNGSNQVANYTDFTTFVKNNGSCVPSGLSGAYVIDYGHATACALNSSVHSPILADASFQGACANWTLVGVSGTGLASTAPTCSNATDEDGDGYYDSFAAISTCGANGSTTCKGTTS